MLISVESLRKIAMNHFKFYKCPVMKKINVFPFKVKFSWSQRSKHLQRASVSFICNTEFSLFYHCPIQQQRGCLCCPHTNPLDNVNHYCLCSIGTARLDARCEQCGFYGRLSVSDSDYP